MKLAEKVISLIEAVKPKPFFGKADGMSWAVNVNGLDNTFPTMPFGRRMDDQKKASEFKKDAKKAYVGAKGKDTLKAVKKWVSDNSPTEFYASWKSDSDMYKDDSIEIAYKK